MMLTDISDVEHFTAQHQQLKDQVTRITSELTKTKLALELEQAVTASAARAQKEQEALKRENAGLKKLLEDAARAKAAHEALQRENAELKKSLQDAARAHEEALAAAGRVNAEEPGAAAQQAKEAHENLQRENAELRKQLAAALAAQKDPATALPLQVDDDPVKIRRAKDAQWKAIIQHLGERGIGWLLEYWIKVPVGGQRHEFLTTAQAIEPSPGGLAQSLAHLNKLNRNDEGANFQRITTFLAIYEAYQALSSCHTGKELTAERKAFRNQIQDEADKYKETRKRKASAFDDEDDGDNTGTVAHTWDFIQHRGKVFSVIVQSLGHGMIPIMARHSKRLFARIKMGRKEVDEAPFAQTFLTRATKANKEGVSIIEQIKATFTEADGDIPARNSGARLFNAPLRRYVNAHSDSMIYDGHFSLSAEAALETYHALLKGPGATPEDVAQLILNEKELLLNDMEFDDKMDPDVSESETESPAPEETEGTATPDHLQDQL